MDSTPMLDTADTYAGQVDPNVDNSSFLEKTGQFVAAMPGAVASDLVNSSGAIVKFFGGDGWDTDEHQMINNLDVFGAGAANYYDTHKGLVDGAELMATSLVPGTLGIKALRAAQTGISGSRMLGTLGFTDVVSPALLNKARATAQTVAKQSAGTWNSLTGELGKALAVGTASQTLDMAAFGATAMVATNASPLYDGMTPLDMVKDWALDSAMMGLGGGAVSGALTMYGVKKAVSTVDAELLKSSNIAIGNASATPGLNISQVMSSYGDAVRASAADGKTVPNGVINAVRNLIVQHAQTFLPDSDKLGQTAVGKFFSKFVDTPANGQPLDAETANFSAKLIGLRRIGDSEIVGNELPVDISNGSIYPNVGSAPQHLGDLMGAKGSLTLGDDATVKMDLGVNAGVKVIDASGKDLDDHIAMQAAYWRAATLRVLPKEVEVSMDNMPMAERMIEEAQAGKSNPTFVDAHGNEMPSVEDAAHTLKDIKITAARALLNSGETPENVAARLNVTTKFLDNPGAADLGARSVSGKLAGKDNLGEFLEQPRIMAAKYDLGITQVPYKSGEKVGQLYTSTPTFNPISRVYAAGRPVTESVYNASVQGNYFPERLVTSPVVKDGVQANTELQQRQAAQYIDNVMKQNSMQRELASNSILGESSTLEKEADILKVMPSVSSTAETAGMFTSANGNYGTITSHLQKLGVFAKRVKDEAVKVVNNQIGASAHLLSQDLGLASEFQLLRTKLASTEANYVLDPAGSNTLVRQDIAINKVRQAVAQAAGKPDFQRVPEMDGDESIATSEKLMQEILQPHTTLNNARLSNRIVHDNVMLPGSSANIALQHGLSPVYNIPVDTTKLKNFFFVTDKSALVGNGSVPSMVLAKDADALLQKRAAIEAAYPGRFDFHTKGDTAAYYKALGDYQYSRGINESFVDSSMRRMGMLADMTPAVGTEGKVAIDLARGAAEEFQAFHQRAAIKEVTDAITMRYADVFNRLDFLGKQYEDVALSKFAPEKALALQEQGIKNPYHNLTNMAIDRSNPRDFPMWQSLNAWTERMGDGVFNTIHQAWSNIASSGMVGEKLDAEVAKLNQLAKDKGLEPLYTDMMVKQFGDQIPTRPVLRKFIAKTQATLNGLMLGFDPMQAVNMALGQVTFAAEFKSLTNMIENSAEGAGALKDLMKVQIPGMDYSINSAVKLHAMSSKAFVAGDKVFNYGTKQWEDVSRADLIKQYTDHGLLTHISAQYSQMLDDLTFTEKLVSDAALDDKWTAILDKGRTLTGNNLAVEYMRFVAVHAARKLTDAAAAAGLIDSEATASTYWNTAVNRMHGISIASQRAQVFQGVIGQSIGMFMTFQHNLFQQLFRYVGTGDTPAIKALGASQFGLYGIQGLPAFNAINTHLIGNAYGNTKHTDVYTSVAKNMDMQTPGNSTAAEWILYGLGSNALGLVHPDLKMNIYSRGEFNPRELTVFPTNVAETVGYKATTQAISNMFDTIGNIANGADVRQSLLHGLEHNGLNRPLAGIAAVIGGQQTTQTGKSLGSTDLNNTGSFWDKFTMANFVRIAGAKPLDDASAADAMYRVAAYQAKTTSDLKNLSESMRMSSQNGNVPDADAMQNFMNEYAKRGGDIRNFRGFAANAYKTANSNQVLALAMKMSNPESKQVQAIMGATNDRAWLQLMNQGQENPIGQ